MATARTAPPPDRSIAGGSARAATPRDRDRGTAGRSAHAVTPPDRSMAGRSARAALLVEGATAGIRWDRVGRIALLILLAGVLALYVRPAIAYVGAWRESKTRQSDITRLEQANRRLLDRRAALRDPQVIEAEARRLGMVRPGERPYVVDGLPAERAP